MIPFLTSWGPAVAWACFIFLLSAQSDLPSTGFLPFGDKVAHFLVFGVLGAALAWGGRLAPGKRVQVGLVLLGCLFAVSDEWHQAHVPRRDPSGGDVLADVVGILAGFALARALLRRGSGPGRSPS
jgi:VanZ family protein